MAEASQDTSLVEYQNFFLRLEPQLHAARILEDELNRRLAHRFNVFDYLGTLELGLSKLIADLLDPKASHGQGSLFLETFFQMVVPDPRDANLDFSSAQITVEKMIDKGRRIDIFMRIPGEKSGFCLAFENKPYAEDQQDQVKDYLTFLSGLQAENFLLIYLSPRGNLPSESIISSKELEKWVGKFAAMPYVIVNDDERNITLLDEKNLVLRKSIVDWLTMCRERCDVERLRWFLRDAEIFCKTTFGHRVMSSDSELRSIIEFLLSNPDLLPTAQSVYEAWPSLKRDMCERFLKHVLHRVKRKVKKMDLGDGLEFGSGYSETRMSRLWLYRKSWREYACRDSDSNGRTMIRLSSHRANLKRWRIGVRSPKSKSSMSMSEQEVRTRLENRLSEEGIGENRNFWWSAYDSLEKYDWDMKLSDLYKECSNGGGDITDYYVKEFVDMVEQTIRIIDLIEESR